MFKLILCHRYIMRGVFVSLSVTGDSHNGQRVNTQRCNFHSGKPSEMHKLPGEILRNYSERDVAFWCNYYMYLLQLHHRQITAHT